MTTLYNLRLLAPNHYAMAKFDSDFNVEAVYNLAPKGTSFSCDCPANNRSVVLKPCKHKRMLPLMLGAVNTDRFYDPERGAWCQPLGDPHREPPIEGEARQGVVEGPTIASMVTLADDANVAEEFAKLLYPDKGEALASEASSCPSPASPPLAASSNGRTPPFEGGNLGSSPSAVAKPAAPTIRRR